MYFDEVVILKYFFSGIPYQGYAVANHYTYQVSSVFSSYHPTHKKGVLKYVLQ